MKIYLAIIEDRHTDVEVKPFLSAEEAIAYAKAQAEINARDKDDIEAGATDSWLFCAYYSPEGDRVRVVEKDLALEPLENLKHNFGFNFEGQFKGIDQVCVDGVPQDDSLWESHILPEGCGVQVRLLGALRKWK